MSSNLFQVCVELGNLHGTSNYVIYWIHGFTCFDSVSHNWAKVLSIPVLLLACSQDWTCNHYEIEFEHYPDSFTQSAAAVVYTDYASAEG